MNERLKRVGHWLEEKGADLAFIQDPSNLFYLSGFECNPHERVVGLIVLPGKEPFILCPRLEENRLKASGWPFKTVGYHDTDNPWNQLRRELEIRGVDGFRTIAVEKEQLSLARSEALADLSPAARFISVAEELERLRQIKDEQEILLLKEAAKWADYGVEKGIEALSEGVTELEVVAAIEHELKRNGIRQMSFSTMVLFAEKSGDPHGTPGTRRLREGDLVLFDLGVVWKGYCSDITRTVAFRSIREEAVRIYDTVLEAQKAALKVCRPGARMRDIDQAARDRIKSAGYGNLFPHRVGHGLGLAVHETPSIHGGNDDVLTEGMCFTVEPGIYVPGLGGVRIEDDVVITREGHERLTRFPKELQIIT
ncbi:Xaa-Pro dipeptidase [Melghirimyces profundicolus]|uniref:Xaa-Pro dipeptidase n=1 Tax=Melghirimyces profundicolus TaxID=1242148 RepID=A0A2T6B7Y0_9BACL|nr:Xaa-Pro peptidase family protein [Melghirimyces profundicolus]PTX52191.1 Xaa-Pro dipeptidase [Melghirimyces profundicolus]